MGTWADIIGTMKRQASARIKPLDLTKPLPVTQKERDRFLAPIDRALLSLAAQNMTVRERRGESVTFDIEDIGK